MGSNDGGMEIDSEALTDIGRGFASDSAQFAEVVEPMRSGLDQEQTTAPAWNSAVEYAGADFLAEHTQAKTSAGTTLSAVLRDFDEIGRHVGAANADFASQDGYNSAGIAGGAPQDT